jgi:hypothetical protein
VTGKRGKEQEATEIAGSENEKSDDERIRQRTPKN